MERRSDCKRLLWWWSLLALPAVHGVLPTAEVEVRLGDGSQYSLLASQASFGSYPAMQAKNNPVHNLILPPADNPLLCDNVTTTAVSQSAMMLVPRGDCTFQHKALQAQRLGAQGILIYGTLASRYALNTTNRTSDYDYTTDDIVYPRDRWDYDCSYGKADIPISSLRLKPFPYNAPHNDPLLSGDTDRNLCQAKSSDHLGHCPSHACLLTGHQHQPSTMEACCAWDLHIWLYEDDSEELVNIPAAYITMQQGRQLQEDLASQSSVQVILFSRYRPTYNPSAALIWMLGVFVAALAAHLSAFEFRRLTRVHRRRQLRLALEQEQQQEQQDEESEESESESTDEETPRARRNAALEVEPTTVSVSSSDEEDESEQEQDDDAPATAASDEAPPQPDEPGAVPYYPASEDAEFLELNAWHALSFIVMASTGLFVLFFFKIYGAVKVLYALGCSKAVAQVLILPLLERFARRAHVKDYIVWRTGTVDFGNISLFDIVSTTLGYMLGFCWLLVAWFAKEPENITFFWVTQDVMGACMCILFLEVIKLNSIRVATLLLLVAFVYDIFFVFITPYIFKGESVMITVATSGGPPKADPSWCEKYPKDPDCQGGEPLPMLLTVPRLGDYQGGSSLLGLGDIVLPGLLLSFAARLDAAKSLIGVITGGTGVINSPYSCPEERICGTSLCSGGYFAPMVVAYAVGLLMANSAVYLMRMGQPALLYLVPCCLGTIVFMGWRRKELKGLWEGPRVIRTADQLVYGRIDSDAVERRGQHALIQRDGGYEAVPLVTANRDTTRDVPLLSGQRRSE